MAFTIGTTKVLNLPEQVEENVKNIEALNSELDTKQDAGTAVNDGNLSAKIEAEKKLYITDLTVGGLYCNADFTNEGNIVTGGTVDIEGKATFGSDAEVDGKLTINSPADIIFKTGSLDFKEITDFIATYNQEAYQYKFAGASIMPLEEAWTGYAFRPSNSFPNFHKATSLIGLFSHANVKGVTDIILPDMDATLPSYVMMMSLADGATAENDFSITLGSGSYWLAYMFPNIEGATTFRQHMKRFVVADGKKAYVRQMDNAFRYCTGLTEIGAFDLSSCTDMGDAFVSDTALKSIHCTHFRVSFNISPSTAFEESDLVEIIGNLDTVTTPQTLTMGATNLAKLTQDEILVATGKGWTLA